MEYKSINFFVLLFNWIKSLFEKTNIGLSEEETEYIMENNTEINDDEVLFKFRIFDEINGYYVNNITIKIDKYIIMLGKIGNDESSSKLITISSNDVDFSKLYNIYVDLTIISKDNVDRINLKDIKLDFNNSYLNSNGILYYKLTEKNLGLRPIVFGDVTVCDYNCVKPYIKEDL